eukprot:m.168840 g.168840  ORF g.168840 m.168840 type:complete len:764 (+) comp25090_c0_seq11:40-2331(+)
MGELAEICVRLEGLLTDVKDQDDILQLFRQEIDDQSQKRWNELEESTREKLLATATSLMQNGMDGAGKLSGTLFALAGLETEHFCQHYRVDATPEQQLEACRFLTAYVECAECFGISLPSNARNEWLSLVCATIQKKELAEVAGLQALAVLSPSMEENFEKDEERRVVLQVLCECTLSNDAAVQAEAMRTIFLMFEHFHPHAQESELVALFEIALNFLKPETSGNVLAHTIEFFSSAFDLLIEARHSGEPAPFLESLLMQGHPVIVERLTTLMLEEPEETGDEWNLFKAASVCLLVALGIEHPDTGEFLRQFFFKHVQHDKSENVNAAAHIFGAAIEHITFPDQSVPFVVGLCQHKDALVRDTAVWALGKVFDSVKNMDLADKYSSLILQAVTEIFNTEENSQVISNACWVVHGLCTSEGDKDPNLLGHFVEVLTKLLPGAPSPCQDAACEALTSLASAARYDDVVLLHQTALSGIENQEEQRIRWLPCLSSCINRLAGEGFYDENPGVMQNLRKTILEIAMEDNTELKEECGIVLAASFSAQDKFDHDTVEAAMTFAMQGLNSGIRTLVIVCAGLVGDICRGFGESFEPFADSTMELFVNLCQEQDLEAGTKAQLLEIFGDIVLALGPKAARYLAVLSQLLMQAFQGYIQFWQSDDLDLREIATEGLDGVFATITAIVHAKLPGVENFLQLAFQALAVLLSSPEKLEETLATTAVGLIGDLAENHPALLKQMSVQDVIAAVQASNAKRYVQKWALKGLEKLQ